ncbi:NEDD8-like protein (RubA) [Emericellopsis cladophorae]|uniref:NEDD8-like protein (RubA) n=1 Tax=Emericellopsis cladophorae TaxID=2686198 RepID=A0A9P9Y351_9HYPO|nr:NEDD8-like protein (RubA) [Emericellopsis cladophorae]KAI6782649.1 NEDD8-like protein (RubA) [Emericellopsis cladophorae]
MKMRLPNILATASLAAAVPTADSSSNKRQDKGLSFGACTDRLTEDTPLECASLNVPLDYTDDSSTDEIRIDIVRVPAAKSPSKGSVFVNFGGPGAPGIQDLGLFYPQLSALTGEQYDLVNVVPRGTNGTLPFSCYSSDEARAYGGYSISGNSSDVSLGYLWAKADLFAQNCAVVMNETGRYIGTAATVRDLFQVVDELEEDGMLRYYGTSYGTLLGSTAAAMFPDRIDKMVLDGVVNPMEYYANREIQLPLGIDGSWQGFLHGCVANPDACPLAALGDADKIATKLFAWLEQLKSHPIVVPDPTSPFGGILYDYSLVEAIIMGGFYFPPLFPQVSAQIYALYAGDEHDHSKLRALVKRFAPGAAQVGMDEPKADDEAWVANDHEALWGIKCSDVLQQNNFKEMLTVFEGRVRNSRFADVAHNTPARCAQWHMPAVERYEGHFQFKPNFPILMVGNTHDPVTPLESARNLSKTIDDSHLIHQDSYGHGLLVQVGMCAAKAVRAYFVDGDLPQEKEVKCAVEVELFDGKFGWEAVLPELTGKPANGTNTTVGARVLKL